MRLVVIAGPANSGKLPLAKRLMAEDPSLVLVHRDALRDALVTRVDEWVITLAMASLADALLANGQSVIVCAWNLEPEDRELWLEVAEKSRVELEWLDVTDPWVAALIPPLVPPDASAPMAA